MIRLGMLLIAVWTIVASPLLCEAGVFAHECHCEADCLCDDELECEEDPCGDPFLRKGESRDDSSPGSTALSPLPNRSSWLAPDRTGAPRATPDRAPPLGSPHPSDLPLLS